MSILGERERQVLHTVITEYIHNSEPVGSRNVSKIGPLRMSPATIRNIMGDLEEKGYLEQPHASAGRIPTDMGYRYYIDHLVGLEGVSDDFYENLETSLDFTPPNVPALMHEFSRRIGAITNSVGFVVASKADCATVKQVEFTRLNRNSVLAILISRSGIVQNVLLNMDIGITDSALTELSNYVNEQLSTMTIQELASKIDAEYDKGAKEVRAILSRLAIMEGEMASDSMFFEGTSNILNFPEFQDAQKLKNLLSALDAKQNVADVLHRFMNTKGVQIFVGSEVGVNDLCEMGLVTQSYEKNGKVLGMLGVIGPKRMEYSKMVRVVNYSAQLITQMLEQLYGGYNED